MLTIGRFARLTRLSVKQLRRYDELGLLAPEFVDADTGYRFYSRGQARAAASVALLRDLDVPLAVVREMLAADDLRVGVLLEGERTRRASELDRLARTVASLTQIASAGALPEAEVDLRVEPPRRLATLRAPGTPDRMFATTAELASAMAAIVPAPSAPFTALFPVDLPETFDVVLGVEVSDPPPGTQAVDLPGGPVATAIHVGPVDTISLTWWPLLAWVHERGLEPAGHLRERYLDDRTTSLTVPLEEE